MNDWYVRTLSVENLVGKYNVDIPLSDVNIIVGRNGSGKSTILKLLKHALTGNLEAESIGKSIRSIDDKFSTARVDLYNGKMESLSKHKSLDVFDNMLSKVLSDLGLKDTDVTSDILLEFKKNLIDKAIVKTDDNQSIDLSKVSSMSEVCTFKTEQDGVFHNLFEDHANLVYVSTFDNIIMSKKEIDQYSGEFYSQLDIEIEKQLAQIMSLDFSRKSIKGKLVKNPEKKRSEDVSWRKLNSFITEVNTFFKSENKELKIGEDKKLILVDGENEIELNDMSSGEKQLIYILLSVANKRDKPTVVLLDEPEISLHLEWQEMLIDSIKSINQDSQIIIVTHSPAIAMNGWMNSMCHMEDFL